MIVEISIGNFLSIKDKVTLSLESGKSQANPQNLIELTPEKVVTLSESPGMSLLKSAAIYGPNASGKSNLIKAVLFLWSLVKSSHSFNVDAKIARIPYKMNQSYLKKPSTFEINFIHKTIRYLYGFSCTEDKIVEEYLHYWPKGRESLIFRRKDTEEYQFNADKEQQETIRKQMNPNVLYLSRATQLGYEKTKGPYEFIVNHLVINYSPQWAGYTLEKISSDQRLKEKIIDILQRTDFGGIVDIEVKKTRHNEFEFRFEKGEHDVMEAKFVHKSEEGKPVALEFNEESAGTQKALSMLGPVFDILDNGKVAFIDELESSLHPSITQFIVKLFHSKHNRTNAQLIFTTHDVTLLDNELLRRDQIYLCTKKPNQQTKLASFLDYDLRESTRFERAYLAGRVGGIPHIDETLFD